MTECVSHLGNYDDFDNPLADDGSLFMPGKRFCNHRDCVNPDHIEGLSKRRPYPKRRPNAGYAEIHAEVCQIALSNQPPTPGEVCRVSVCTEPAKGRGLCVNHHLMLRRLMPELVGQRKPLTLADFPPVPSSLPFNQRLANKNTHEGCAFKDCKNKHYGRTLCASHLRNYQRLLKKEA